MPTKPQLVKTLHKLEAAIKKDSRTYKSLLNDFKVLNDKYILLEEDLNPSLEKSKIAYEEIESYKKDIAHQKELINLANDNYQGLQSSYDSTTEKLSEADRMLKASVSTNSDLRGKVFGLEKELEEYKEANAQNVDKIMTLERLYSQARRSLAIIALETQHVNGQ